MRSHQRLFRTIDLGMGTLAQDQPRMRKVFFCHLKHPSRVILHLLVLGGHPLLSDCQVVATLADHLIVVCFNLGLKALEA